MLSFFSKVAHCMEKCEHDMSYLSCLTLITFASNIIQFGVFEICKVLYVVMTGPC